MTETPKKPTNYRRTKANDPLDWVDKRTEIESKSKEEPVTQEMIAEPVTKETITNNEEIKMSEQSIVLSEILRIAKAFEQGVLSERAKIVDPEHAETFNALNALIDAALLPLGESNRILRHMRGCDLRNKIEIVCHGEHEIMKDTINGIHGWMLDIIAYITKIANGDFSAEPTKASEQDQIYDSLVLLKTNLKQLVEDTAQIANASIEGRLEVRADVTKNKGEYRIIVEGVNTSLDAIIEPLRNISIVIDAMDNNDLSAELKGEYRGEFLRIKDSFESAMEKLNASLYQISDTVDQVSVAAEQLNLASNSLASAAEEQSSAVEEVTSAIEETDSQVRANTDNANAANQLVMTASQAADQGRTKMQSMSNAMGAINNSSQSIAKIIKVIDEIAFQTNLLALNAAVEAARAGQHGRGFAVVAQEVRNLAGRSAKAARETADLIDESTKRVNDGVSIAAETGEALDLIVGNVLKVKDLVAEISTASVEQSRGISQINVAMGQIAAAARLASQQSEELSSASSELSTISSQTQHELSRFKLRERQVRGGAGLLNLESITPEMLRQLQILLGQQTAPKPVAAPKPAAHSAPAKKSPKHVMPLDEDERGFGKF
jgi:methyl-accepting chemotaxis protein